MPGRPVRRCNSSAAAATGTDTLTLQQTATDTYAGSGTFFAPLRCAGRVYPHGQEVPFRITVHITAVTGDVASTISATYVNRSRINLTRCVGVLGHDAARYTGSSPPAEPAATAARERARRAAAGARSAGRTAPRTGRTAGRRW